MHPTFCAHLIIYFGVLNLGIWISFLYVRTLHYDEDVHRRRSRAEFGLVLIGLTKLSYFLLVYVQALIAMMARLQVCIGMSEPLLIVYVISFSFSSTGSCSELRT